MLDALEPGHRVRRGLWVALGFVVAIAAYFAYAACVHAAWEDANHTPWEHARHDCTPANAAYQGLDPHYDGSMQVLCFAAARRFDLLAERLDGANFYDRELWTNDVLFAAHYATHDGDPAADVAMHWVSHRLVYGPDRLDNVDVHDAFASYHAGDDTAARGVLVASRDARCRSVYAAEECANLMRAVADIDNHVPLAQRTAHCPFERSTAVAPWVAARVTCSGDRIDHATCVAAEGRLAELRDYLAALPDADRMQERALLEERIRGFLATDTRARDVLELLVATMTPGRNFWLVEDELSVCHLATARRILQAVPRGSATDWNYAEAQRRLAMLQVPPSCR
jgi:hypothetical protein